MIVVVMLILHAPWGLLSDWLLSSARLFLLRPLHLVDRALHEAVLGRTMYWAVNSCCHENMSIATNTLEREPGVIGVWIRLASVKWSDPMTVACQSI